MKRRRGEEDEDSFILITLGELAIKAFRMTKVRDAINEI